MSVELWGALDSLIHWRIREILTAIEVIQVMDSRSSEAMGLRLCETQEVVLCTKINILN